MQATTQKQDPEKAQPQAPKVMRLAIEELVPALNEHVRPFHCIKGTYHEQLNNLPRDCC